MTIDKQSLPVADNDPAPEMPFRRLLYRFLFFDWLFRDVSAARDRIERHAARQHNRKMSRYLPVYLRRWSFLTAFDFALGYRFLSGHPVLNDSSRFDFSTYTRLTEDWGLGTRHILELDDSTLELQQYTLHRDLGNWVAGMGVSMRDNRREEEYGLVFSLTLKDFPSVSLPFEIDAE